MVVDGGGTNVVAGVGGSVVVLGGPAVVEVGSVVVVVVGNVVVVVGGAAVVVVVEGAVVVVVVGGSGNSAAICTLSKWKRPDWLGTDSIRNLTCVCALAAERMLKLWNTCPLSEALSVYVARVVQELPPFEDTETRAIPGLPPDLVRR